MCKSCVFTECAAQAVNGINVAGLTHDVILEVIKSSDTEIELLLLVREQNGATFAVLLAESHNFSAPRQSISELLTKRPEDSVVEDAIKTDVMTQVFSTASCQCCTGRRSC